MITGNEPAMPFQSSELSGMNEAHHGLTIRQHFAAMCLQGILSNHKSFENAKNAMVYKGIPIDDNATEAVKGFCHFAANLADALIEELNKEK